MNSINFKLFTHP